MNIRLIGCTGAITLVNDANIAKEREFEYGTSPGPILVGNFFQTTTNCPINQCILSSAIPDSSTSLKVTTTGDSLVSDSIEFLVTTEDDGFEELVNIECTVDGSIGATLESFTLRQLPRCGIALNEATSTSIVMSYSKDIEFEYRDPNDFFTVADPSKCEITLCEFYNANCLNALESENFGFDLDTK